MTRRICPQCGQEAFSAADGMPVWKCGYCKGDIPREQGKTLKEITDRIHDFLKLGDK